MCLTSIGRILYSIKLYLRRTLYNNNNGRSQSPSYFDNAHGLSVFRPSQVDVFFDFALVLVDAFVFSISVHPVHFVDLNRDCPFVVLSVASEKPKQTQTQRGRQQGCSAAQTKRSGWPSRTGIDSVINVGFRVGFRRSFTAGARRQQDGTRRDCTHGENWKEEKTWGKNDGKKYKNRLRGRVKWATTTSRVFYAANEFASALSRLARRPFPVDLYTFYILFYIPETFVSLSRSLAGNDCFF